VSLRAIAAELNRRGMRTRRGRVWQVSNVGNLVSRVKGDRISANSRLSDCEPVLPWSNADENIEVGPRASSLSLSFWPCCLSPVRKVELLTVPSSREFLKLWAGPGLGFKTTLGLPDGTLLTRRTCATEVANFGAKLHSRRARNYRQCLGGLPAGALSRVLGSRPSAAGCMTPACAIRRV
jgi:hypothetical protein